MKFSTLTCFCMSFLVYLTQPVSAQTRHIGNKPKSATMTLSCEKGSEIGILVNAGRKGGKLKRLNILLDGKPAENAKFRVNVYDLEGEFPGNNIVNNTITGHIRKDQPFISVDITPYNINISNKVLLSIERIEAGNNLSLPFSSGLLNGGTWTKSVAGEWKKTPVIGVGFDVQMLKETS